jgi:uncharacterized protein (TIGR02145 family)
VIIGTQEWMVENLKTSSYNDGTPIYRITSSEEWKTTESPAYCWYNNIIDKDSPKGAFYNWYAIRTGKLTPIGWHIPSDEEWKTLETFIGMSRKNADELYFRGEHLGTALKADNSWSVTYGMEDEWGFEALSAGGRNGYSGYSFDFGFGAYFWTSTHFNMEDAWCRSLVDSETTIGRHYVTKRSGMSIRCVKD